MHILLTPQHRLVPTLLIFLLLHKNPRNTTTLLAGAEVRSFTSYNNVLAGFVYQATEMLDWLECIQACQQDVRCISYNFWSSFGTKCELNSCGFEDECSAEKMLIWFRGGIFQQVKQAKVYSFIITALSCPKLREAGHQRKTKKGKTLYWETPREDHAFSFEKRDTKRPISIFFLMIG